LDRADAGAVQHEQGLVNRYTVDAVEADLMLGFFFPGARIAVDETGTSVLAAGASAAEAPAAAAGASSAKAPTPAADDSGAGASPDGGAEGSPAAEPPGPASTPAPTA
jgi:hypothetical protein